MFEFKAHDVAEAGEGLHGLLERASEASLETQTLTRASLAAGRGTLALA